MKRFLTITVPATIVGVILSAALLEIWVRASWDDRRGTPGFFLSDPVRGNRLAPNYSGWFAGVPVHINSLGFRDTRDYAIEKAPGTFRIVILGDSVTFGHGTLDSTTYPYLLEQRLKEWRPEVQWQVWNLGVPGYNTAQELAYLEEVGPRYKPDLVIVGFYANDLMDNELHAPTLVRRTSSALQRFMQQHLYSYEFYKRTYLTARWRLMTDDADRQRIEALAGEAKLVSSAEDLSQRPDQQLTNADFFDDEAVRQFACPAGAAPDNADSLAAAIQGESAEVRTWRNAVRGFQELNRTGRYRVMFFINMAPDACPDHDRFFAGGTMNDDQALRNVLGAADTAVASSTAAFLHYRPSQMPGASGHAWGNSNRVKADALFQFLRADVLPGMLVH